LAEIHSTVEEARKAIWGDVAEAHALVQLSRSTEDEAALGYLAVAILGRLLASFDRLETELSRHGFPSLASRFEPQAPASGDVAL
jgi:hypothetical protein